MLLDEGEQNFDDKAMGEHCFDRFLLAQFLLHVGECECEQLIDLYEAPHWLQVYA